MESSGRKKRGLKGMIVMSLYRAPKSSSMQYSSKMKPAPSSSASVNFLVEDEFTASTKLKAAPAKGGDFRGYGGGDYDGFGGYDDSVDKRAAQYISYVQERFKLEQIDYDRRMYY